MHVLHQVASIANQLPGLIADLIEADEIKTAKQLLRAWDEKTMTYIEIYMTATEKLKSK